MKKLSALFIVFGFIVGMSCQGAFAFQSDSRENGTLISKDTYVFPSYEEAVEKTDAEKYASKEEYEKAVADKKFEFSKLRYKSDGLKVTGYLYKPKTVRTKLPVIVFNRGSFVRGDIAPELVAFFHRLASEGFVIVAPLYRQSDGGEGRDEMGGGDVNDLMNIVPLIKSFDFADSNNMFMYGESRGGIMTYLAIRRKFPVNAAAVFGATSDMDRLLKDTPKSFPPAFLNQVWIGYEENRESIIKSRSAIDWPEELNAPLLIMHGGADGAVNPEQSLNLAQQLQKLGKPYQLIVYAGDGHILSNNKENRDQQAVSWFKKYIKK